MLLVHPLRGAAPRLMTQADACRLA